MNDPGRRARDAETTIKGVHAPQIEFGPLLMAIRDAAIVGDGTSDRIALWNPAAEGIFGYSAEEALGLPIEMLFPDHLREEYRAGLATFVELGSGAWDEVGSIRELIVTDPEVLDEHVLQYKPQVVVCSHLTAAVETQVPTWAILYPDGAAGAMLQIGGQQQTVGDIDLEGIIALLTD